MFWLELTIISKETDIGSLITNTIAKHKHEDNCWTCIMTYLNRDCYAHFQKAALKEQNLWLVITIKTLCCSTMLQQFTIITFYVRPLICCFDCYAFSCNFIITHIKNGRERMQHIYPQIYQFKSFKHPIQGTTLPILLPDFLLESAQQNNYKKVSKDQFSLKVFNARLILKKTPPPATFA